MGGGGGGGGGGEGKTKKEIYSQKKIREKCMRFEYVI